MSDASTNIPMTGTSGTTADRRRALSPPPRQVPDNLDDFLRLAMMLGSGALFEFASNPGILRGVSPADVTSMKAGQGMSPVAGSNPKAASSAAEMTFRHTRPKGNARIAGTDRISWTTRLDSAVKRARQHGTNQIVALKVDKLKALRIRMMTPDELLRHLSDWERKLNLDLANATSKTQADKAANRLRSLGRARDYVRSFIEHQTVGKVPQGAIDRNIMLKIRAARGAGAILLGLSILMGIHRVLEAEPDRQGAVALGEVAAFGLDLIAPGSGPIGRYGVETLNGELRTLSILFPTVYTWVIDAYFGEVFEAADPEGARYIRKAMQTQQGQVDLIQRLFGGF